MLTLGNKIKKVRELKGLKQEYMAEVLGISQPSYSKIETDEVSVSPERLEQIAKVLQVTVQDILAFDEKTIFNLINSMNNSMNPAGVNTNNNPVYNFSMPEQMQKLYEDKIKLLEDLVEMQKKEIERLKGEK